VLDRLQSAAGGLVIHSTMTSADVTEIGAMTSHSEGIIDLLSQSESAEVAILFKEAGPATTRVSVRTRIAGVDATVLTGLFGGGGHARAAGASIDADVATARARVLPEAERLATAVRR
ncbi:MAG: DHHA1 domain-containing protein, partial [Dehalococcoidia bacterium]